MENLKKKIEPVNCNHSELCIFLQDLEEGYLPTCSLDTHQFVPSSGRTIASKPWQHGKKTGHFPSFQYTMMSKSSAENLGEEKSKSSAEDFHARTFQSQEKEQELKARNLPCGNTWRELCLKCSPDTSSLKTVRCLWEEDLPLSSVTLPKWGTMLNGELWERTTLPRLTSGTGSGSSQSWATPTTMDTLPPKSEKALLKEAIEVRPGRSKPANLRDQVSNGHLWPTPTVNDSHNCTMPPSQMTRDNLPGALLRKGDRPNGGHLNPAWVEWLMGWPLGWTSMEAITELDWRDWSVDPADGEPSKQSPTPSSNPRGAYTGREMCFETLSTVSNTTGTRYGMTIETYAHHKPGGGEVPRVTTGIKHRIGRLKAIGNGQVPQVAALAWQILTK